MRAWSRVSAALVILLAVTALALVAIAGALSVGDPPITIFQERERTSEDRSPLDALEVVPLEGEDATGLVPTEHVGPTEGPVLEPGKPRVLGPSTFPTEQDQEEPVPEKPVEADPPREDPKDAEPEEEVTQPGPVEMMPLVELKLLAELEGEQDFSRSSDPYGWYGAGQGQGQGQGQYEEDGVADSANPAEREIEEADIVKVRGDLLYLLSGYRGLIIVDVSDPDDPEPLGAASVVGNPVDMYIYGDRAYVLVSCDYGYWYWYRSSSSRWAGGYPRYQIGTRLLVIDITLPYNPFVVSEVPIEGFAVDSRRVGDVIYYVSRCYSWYNRYAGTTMEDMTYVMSVNVADPWNIFAMDCEEFEGPANEIHVTTQWLYVAQYDRKMPGMAYGGTNFTIVDISDPTGRIALRDTFTAEGAVQDRYQMDHWGNTFRVVCHLGDSWRSGASYLRTFDVSDPDAVGPLGNVLVDRTGTLTATRFAGDRGYTIHLPRSIDPLEVIDISDPAHPVLCDVLEMPGWVTHMEVRGYKIVAIGVDDSGGERNVAVSLFDVSDPFNAVMEDRVRVGGKWAYSAATFDPKALTVLDDLELVLVPFYSYYQDEDYYYRYINGVQLVSFDLEEGDLELCGIFEQPDSVLRTRCLGDRVVSTSNRYLVVADISDPSEPRVTAELDLAPYVADYGAFEGGYAEIVLDWSTYTYELRVFEEGASDIGTPLWCQDLDESTWRWFWRGPYLFVVSLESTDPGDLVMGVTRYDLARGQGHGDSLELSLGASSDNRDLWYYGYYYGYAYGYGQGSGCGQCDSSFYHRGSGQGSVGNLVMLDGGRMAFYSNRTLRTVDLMAEDGPVLATSINLDCGTFHGILPVGRDPYVIGSVTHQVSAGDQNYTLRSYTLYPVLMGSRGTFAAVISLPVPGQPLGASDDGSYIYTQSSWLLEDGSFVAPCLNVLTVNCWRATMLYAIDLDGMSCYVVDDAAVLTRWSYESGRDEDGHWWYSYNMTLLVVDLPTGTMVKGFWFDDYVYVMYAGQGLVMLQRTGVYGLTVLDLAEPGSVRLTTLAVRPYFSSVHRQGDVVHVSCYSYGVVRLNLGP